MTLNLSVCASHPQPIPFCSPTTTESIELDDINEELRLIRMRMYAISSQLKVTKGETGKLELGFRWLLIFLSFCGPLQDSIDPLQLIPRNP